MTFVSSRNLTYTYPEEKEITFPDFSVEKNSSTLIFGPSGSGKTTLLHLISGIRKIQKGSIQFENNELQNLSSKDLDQYRAQNIGLVFQKSIFISSLNVLENILMPNQFNSNSRLDKDQALDLLNELGIGEKINKRINLLSVGELQRVSIARAFLSNPKLLIADEPSSALDDKNAEKVIEIMFDLTKKYSSTLLVVSHDQRLKSHFSNKIEIR